MMEVLANTMPTSPQDIIFTIIAFLQGVLRTDSAYCKYSPWVVTGKRLESTFRDKGRSVTLEQS